MRLEVVDERVVSREEQVEEARAEGVADDDALAGVGGIDEGLRVIVATLDAQDFSTDRPRAPRSCIVGQQVALRSN